MRNYYRVIIGKSSAYIEEAYKENFIAIETLSDIDFSNKLYDNWRNFNKEFIPVFLKNNPERTKISAGLACGMLWTVIKGIQVGDIVLCPNGQGNYYVGEIVGEYKYYKNEKLPHRREVKWYLKIILKEEMSLSLRNSISSAGPVIFISKHTDELNNLLSDNYLRTITTTDETVEDPTVFALEKHLEDFLVKNWKSTDLGKNYDIYEEDGEIVGQQFQSDTGPIDILAISKDKKSLLVVELKKGRVSDVVVGQCQRYMGYVKDELAEKNQIVRGVIIAFEDDVKIRRCLSVTQNIEFYTYKINFKLEKKIIC